MALEWILFDCMETLVDMDPIPQQIDYAGWAFHGSGVEACWKTFDSFFCDYQKAAQFLEKKLPPLKEWTVRDRLALACGYNNVIDGLERDDFISTLEKNFFKNYLQNCFVHKDVIEMLPVLAKQYKLGVVSNFKTEDGIETILKSFDLIRYFSHITTSVKNGWRKPNPEIYKESIGKCEVEKSAILFIGDDLECDVKTPMALGMQAIYFNRNNKKQAHSSFITVDCFSEIPEKIDKTILSPKVSGALKN